MVVFLIVSGLLFSGSRTAEKYIVDDLLYQKKLIINDLKMIDIIEEIEIEMIKKGLNPDSLTLEQVKEILNKKMQNKHNMREEKKEKKYQDFLDKINDFKINKNQ